MSRINAPLKRNINVTDENDASIIKTPYKPASSARQFGTPLMLPNTPRSTFAKPTPKTPGLNLLSKPFLANAAFKTPMRQPDFEVFQDEIEEEEMHEDVEGKSPPPHLSPVEEEDDEPDTCIGQPIYHLNEQDFDYMKDVEDVELYDPSIESFKKIYGDPADLVIEDFWVRLPHSDNECKYEIDEHDDFFDFLQYA